MSEHGTLGRRGATDPVAGSGVVVFRRTGNIGDIDAIDEYSRRLVDALVADGVEARYEAGGLRPVLAAASRPAWVLLQYNPFRFGRRGFAPGLARDALRLRHRSVPLLIMVHEAWVPMVGWRTRLIGRWQRMQLRMLLRLSEAVLTSTEALARELGHEAAHMPIATNISPVPISPRAARDRLGLNSKLTVTLFGRAHESRAHDHSEAAIAALARAYGAHRLVILNLGADAPRPRVPPAVELRSPGCLAPEELSRELSASDIVLLPLTDGVSTRRGTLMAALAHGRPVLGLRGHSTDTVLAAAPDALVLTPVGEPSAFARTAVELAGDPARLRQIGEAGRRLYEAEFDWPVLARNVGAVLESITARRRRTAVAGKR
jgi:glycosyltransferase involved in cell wall biosynthesis